MFEEYLSDIEAMLSFYGLKTKVECEIKKDLKKTSELIESSIEEQEQVMVQKQAIAKKTPVGEEKLKSHLPERVIL